MKGKAGLPPNCGVPCLPHDLKGVPQCCYLYITFGSRHLVSATMVFGCLGHCLPLPSMLTDLMGTLDSLNVRQRIARSCFFATGLSHVVKRHISADNRLWACHVYIVLLLCSSAICLSLPFPIQPSGLRSVQPYLPVAKPTQAAPKSDA